MAAGDKSPGPSVSVGEEAGTGSAIKVQAGFRPAAVEIHNRTSGARMFWHKRMPEASGSKNGPSFVPYMAADIKGSANTDSENADAASLPTNGGLLAAAAAISGIPSPVAITTNPDVGRNVVIAIQNTTGGALNLFQGITTFTVTGTYRGDVQTEAITITSTGGNKSVAAAKFRYKYGILPFDTVTSVAYDNTPDTGLSLAVGIGSKIGIPVGPWRAANASVVKLFKNAADLSPSGIVDATNLTVNFGTLANADDVGMIVKTAHLKGSFVTTNGISTFYNGFQIGTDADINTSSDVIYWTAWKF